MSKRIYVGNLPYSVDDDALREMFASHGEVTDAKVIPDKFTGRSKGFGFVEMTDAAAGDAAIKALNDTEIGGRKLVVNEAREREERPRFGGNSGGGGNGGGGYNSNGGGRSNSYGQSSSYTPKPESKPAASEEPAAAADEAPETPAE